MALPRAYIPSIAVLRALSRPTASKCPFARPLLTQSLRGKASKASKTRAEEFSEEGPESWSKLRKGKGLNGSGISAIEWWEQDLDRQTPERLITRIDQPWQVRRLRKMNEMMDKRDSDPKYDDTELGKMQIEDLMDDPNFADIRDRLEEIKNSLPTKAERDKVEKDMDDALKQAEADEADFNAMILTNFHECFQGMIDDPELADAKEDLMDLQSRMTEWRDLENPEFYDAIERIGIKLESNPAWQERVRKIEDPLEEPKDEDAREMKELLAMAENPEESEAGLDNFLDQLRTLASALPGERSLKEEIEYIRSPAYQAELDAELQSQIDNMTEETELEDTFTELHRRVTKLQSAVTNAPVEDEDKYDPRAEALKEKILDDPRLMDKLKVITDILKDPDFHNTDFVTLTTLKSAPDPSALPPSELTTLGHQMKVAENDPEHIAAMRRLKVNLLPPFNVHPAVRSLNQALKIAYCGATDDIRRILWRTYAKARTVPTLLQSLPDDAWDILWYSQAVVWKGNQNRKNHLAVLLRDLHSVGRAGPPTMPEAGIESGVSLQALRLQKIREVLLEGIEE
ncbi:hypothetical protein P154DRAFT_520110 [Amniculicola lignicola CBS 123094]|uniref:Uncharacterized protein n=1 Tax=Amniculicola lignicola CBS 123094 TaxID=1392246 RepID=A0A6A5WP85_9PLEO|nr:hypothetical protein P154DRAFT_520110 [Amniculicola lignicola CBS 123094]